MWRLLMVDFPDSSIGFLIDRMWRVHVTEAISVVLIVATIQFSVITVFAASDVEFLCSRIGSRVFVFSTMQ
jgi:hypothetical protein